VGVVIVVVQDQKRNEKRSILAQRQNLRACAERKATTGTDALMGVWY
jgi:hypothetical protein